MDNESNDLKKWANFYLRLRKQYEQGKPFTYEVDLVSNQAKPRATKFMIMITKFISIFKWGIRQTYDNQDDRRENYWTQLSKHFHNDLQMGFVNQGYWEKPKNKIKKYFALLVYTKRIFKILEESLNKMGYMYQNQDEKRKNYQQQIKNLNFLQDGNYRVMGEIITSFEQYANKRREQQKIKQIQRIKQEKRKQQQQLKRIQKERLLQQQRKQNQRRQQQELKKRQQVEQRMRQEQNQKRNKQQQQADRIITSQYIPSDYKPAFINNVSQKIRKDPSSQKLDLPNHRQHDRKLKNSQRLFLEEFKGELQVFSYSLKPQFSEDKSTCFACKCNLKQGIYFLGGNQNFCYYTGKWYCNNDISEDRMAIPWKAIQSFDLKGYSVSKVAYAQLKAYYEKNIVEIKRQNPIIKQSKILHDFLVVKRQIHLIYDSICNIQLIQPIVRGRKNYCLKMNLFSMKNLYDIYNGHQTSKWQKQFQLLSKHFYKCDICQKKKGYICPICQDPVKIFPFQFKQIIGCVPCKKFYHRKCLPSGICKCKQEE